MASQSDPQVSRYISRSQAVPKLSREDEVELAQAWLKHGDQGAADKLIAAHLRYVVAIAIKYRRYGLPIGELISEGNFGLVHALSKFEPERGNRFVTYAAYWIRAYILNYIIRSWSLVGVGSGALRSKMFFKLRRERVKITNLLGEGEAADNALAEMFGVSTPQLRSMMRRLESRDVSLDTKVFDDAGTTMVDTLVSEAQDQETTLATSQVGQLRRDAVSEAVKVLDPRERFIVEERLMAHKEDELSLAEIGRRLGVSRERARQLEARAKRKLRAEIVELARSAGADLVELDSAA